ncbi:NAC domain-containing protein 82-like isoform X1 [Solanum tuberosum]|uniref:NAC domain-containing protein 82-like isoform X1 n=1 Tax=Solanum tuberosum TaxID=4113 RepID=UPI00073A4D6E|nr:PREDICTED: NAC domain-containing protein 82-like isoform X1 [Solanum tuberosum]XP_015165758.1 PREDICTED: NAC domain-containing protein 82-like isoform X1 [Solanum tuberosum]
MARLPPGFRFHPTDVELIMYYLKRKITGKKFHFEVITELNIYKFSPWDLPDKCCYKSKDLEWYFFCPRERKYASGGRMNRATDSGYWKTTGKDRYVTYDEKIVGSVKTLVFHLGHPPRGQRTDWLIHEYKFEDKESIDAGFAQDSYVLYKVFQKSGPGPKNGAQYGAPFKEEDWEDDKIPAEPCTSDVFPAPPGRPDKPSTSNATRVVDPGSTSVWPSSELSPSPIQPSVQKLPLDEPDDEELPGEPKLSNVSSINWMPSDQLKAKSSNIFSALPILPEKQSCSVDTSLANPGPGPSNDQMCTNEMAPDELDDEMIGLFTQFTEDTSLLSGGNETNQQKLENFHQDVNAPSAAFTDGNDIFDDLGDIEVWARVGQLEPDLTASGGANYSLNPVILPQDAAYMELNDLDIPLNHPAETIGTGQLVPGHFCTPYNSNIGMQQLCFGSNSLGIVQDFGEHRLPTLPESYTQQVNHPDMAYNFQNNANHGYNAATNFSVSSYKQPEESRLDAQNLERGVQQRKFYLSIFALWDGSFLLVKAEVTFGVDGCTDDALSVVLGEQRKLYSSIFALCGGSFILVKAEVTLGVDGCTNDALSVILGEQRKLYLSIFALCGGSFILVKAEVILGVDGCTNDALSVILGNPSFTFTRVSNVDKADFSKKTHVAFCFGFSLAFICFSHVEMLWFNSLWELYQFIVFKILLNQLQFNSSGTPFHLHFISAIKLTSALSLVTNTFLKWS